MSHTLTQVNGILTSTFTSAHVEVLRLIDSHQDQSLITVLINWSGIFDAMALPSTLGHRNIQVNGSQFDFLKYIQLSNLTVTTQSLKVVDCIAIAGMTSHVLLAEKSIPVIQARYQLNSHVQA